MNGAGNKILVLDMRGAPVRPAPADARAIHRAPHLDYDQMMVIGDPHTAGTAPTCSYTTTTAPSPALAATARAASPTGCAASLRSARSELRPRPASSPASVWARGPIESTWARRGSIGTPFRSHAPS